MFVLNLLAALVCIVAAVHFGQDAIRFWSLKHRYVSSVTSGLFAVALALYAGYYAANWQYAVLISSANVLIGVVVALFLALQFRRVVELAVSRQRLYALSKASFAIAMATLLLAAIVTLPQWTYFVGVGFLLLSLIVQFKADKQQLEYEAQMRLARAQGLLDEMPVDDHANDEDACLARILAVKDRPAIEV